jgi:glycosyltransferase involved in cell wall biosynthesis
MTIPPPRTSSGRRRGDLDGAADTAGDPSRGIPRRAAKRRYDCVAVTVKADGVSEGSWTEDKAAVAGRQLRVAILWLGLISRDTAARTYLSEILGPLGEEPDLDVDVHLGDRDFTIPPTCRAVWHRVPYRLGSGARIGVEPLVAARLRRRYDVLLAPFGNLPPTWRGASVVVHHNVLAFGSELRKTLSLSRALWRPLATRTSVRNATRTIAISEYLRSLLLERFDTLDPRTVDVAPYGVRPAPLVERPRTPVDARAPRLLAVSALWPYKRIDQAIETLALIRNEFPLATLSVAGPDAGAERARLEALADRLGAGDAVCFVGNLPQEELREAYRSSDVLLYLSEIESFGLPVLEAMMLGTPVVARRIPGVAEIGGEGPFWIRPDGNAEETADVVRRALTDEASRSLHVRISREQASRFTWRHAAELTAGAVRAAAAEGPPIADAGRRPA